MSSWHGGELGTGTAVSFTDLLFFWLIY